MIDFCLIPHDVSCVWDLILLVRSFALALYSFLLCCLYFRLAIVHTTVMYQYSKFVCEVLFFGSLGHSVENLTSSELGCARCERLPYRGSELVSFELTGC